MAYHRALDDLSELSDVIMEVGTLLGGFGRSQGPEFAADVLRIKVSGPIVSDPPDKYDARLSFPSSTTNSPHPSSAPHVP